MRSNPFATVGSCYSGVYAMMIAVVLVWVFGRKPQNTHNKLGCFFSLTLSHLHTRSRLLREQSYLSPATFPRKKNTKKTHKKHNSLRLLIALLNFILPSLFLLSWGDSFQGRGVGRAGYSHNTFLRWQKK